MGGVRFNPSRLASAAFALALAMLTVTLVGGPAQALAPLPEPDPVPGSFGLEATKKQAPPKSAPTISSPGNGASSNQRVTIRGICQTGLLIEVYNNKAMVGAAMCERGSFSVPISLFDGTNDITAIGYDDLGQASPTSNRVRITYRSPEVSSFGDMVMLTSRYGRRAESVGKNLTWPIQISGGSGPYALSIDWGDGSEPELKSQSSTGEVMLGHKYQRAGIYIVGITATDSNGTTAFMQVIALASGDAVAEEGPAEEERDRLIILWIPAALTVILLVPAYWLGRRSQLTALRRRLEQERDAYAGDQPEDT